MASIKVDGQFIGRSEVRVGSVWHKGDDYWLVCATDFSSGFNIVNLATGELYWPEPQDDLDALVDGMDYVRKPITLSNE